MNKFFTLLLLLFVLTSKAQLLTTTPDFIQESSTSITITMDASKGNQGLYNYANTSDVYVHTGVITNKSTGSSDWKHVPFTWGTTNTSAKCISIGSNKWLFPISGGLRTFYGLSDPTEKILYIAILFRNGAGSTVQRNADASDMYIPVYDNGLYARIDLPARQPLFKPIPETITKKLGDVLSISAKASLAGTLTIFFNGTQVGSSTTTAATANPTISTTGNQQIIAVAINGGQTSSDTLNFVIANTNTVAPLPSGLKDGINYEAGDTSATLVLYAPNKKNVFVLGDFNNWTQQANYQMNQTPDSARYWLRLTGLTPGVEYAYQYFIDGTLKVADYNTEKILDPYNDQYISAATYPNLKAYPTGLTSGNVSILQTAKPVYNWQATNYTRPDKRNLIIYELLVRDFTAAQNFQTLKDTLTYLKRLGINAIELMPINEFEGNISWGYNPSFFLAPDKAYGTETAVKQFIDVCHQQGIAVIMDMVMNHACGTSPMAQMYWDATNNRPAANSPWFNTIAKHDFNVCNDFNHESQATKDLVARVVRHWLTNYKIDGFRWDLAKGFTQNNTLGNTGAWGNYDPSRVAIWKRIYDTMQAASANSYCILEHFADNSEETVLANYGMMPWGNMNYAYGQAGMGYSSGWDLSNSVYANKGWSQNNLVTYMESHDEEREMYRYENFGNIYGSYNIQNKATGLNRVALCAAIWSSIPGPKMMYEYEELGYDYPINYCQNGSVNNSCRTDPKPVGFSLATDAARLKLYNTFQRMFALRNYPAYLSTFTTGTIANNYDLTGSVKWLKVVDNNLSIVTIGNFDVTPKTATIIFPNTGTWYSYFAQSDSSFTIFNTTVTFNLAPGEFYVFTSKNAKKAIALPVEWTAFTAKKTTNEQVILNWTVTNEINNLLYEVERSTDLQHFSAIGTVTASDKANGKYQFIDNTPLNGTTYYRIKQIDKNGAYSYSIIINVVTENRGETWQVYPNLAHNNTILHVLANTDKIQITVTDLLGKTVYTSQSSNNTIGKQINIPLHGIGKGYYILKVNSDKAATTQKIMVY